MAPQKSTKPSKTSSSPSILTKYYLISYNLAQVIGWSYMLYQLFAYYTIDKSTTQTLWEYIGLTVIIFQNAALLEIIHAAIGIVRSNVIITTFQVFSRVMIVLLAVIATPNGKLSTGLPLALLAWSITEIIRYGYYALNLLEYVPKIVVWLRYTTFIILYPIGVTGELWCYYSAQEYAKENTQAWSMELPNKYNFAFSFYYCLWFIMLSYIPFFPHLYLHMFSQRNKILGADAKKK